MSEDVELTESWRMRQNISFVLQGYEAEVRAREGRQALHKDLEGVFGALRRAPSSTSAAHAAPPAAPPAKLTKAPSVSKLKKAASFSKTKTGSKKTVAGSKVAMTMKARAAYAAKGKVVSKVKAVTIPRKLMREKVPDSNFRFSQLHWSPWKLAAVPVETEVKSGQWRRFLKGCARGRGGMVVGAGCSKGSKQGSVLCEAAVQTRPGARRHVVWCRVLPASSANRLSLSRLLSSQSVRKQLERVMRGGCRLWVRWASVSGRGHGKVNMQQEVKDVYNYAWCPSREGCRDVWVPASGVTTCHRMQIAGTVA